MLALYHFGPVANSLTPLLCLLEKGLEFDNRLLDSRKWEHHDPAFRAINPEGMVPVLLHDGRVVRESTVINEYLEDVFPEQPLRRGQILVLQVPVPEPLRGVVASMDEQRRMHAEADYAKVWVRLYEDIVRNGLVSHSADYPCLVNGRYVIAPSPIPRFDVPKLNDGEALVVLSAGREKRIYAIPPHTRVEPLTFEDVPFVVEHTEGARCAHCGSEDTYLIGVPEEDGGTRWVCSDTDWCSRHRDNSSNPANPDNGAVRAVAAGTEGRVA